MNKKSWVFVGLATELIGLVGAAAFLGHLADQHWGLSGLGLASGAILSLVMWFTHLIWAIRQMEKEE